jgi:ribosomal protein S12 methylthiotransferase accessory factor
VKVIVPGALPMTFGHGNRRVHGLLRLLEVLRLLGYRHRALLPQEVNPHPHHSRDRAAHRGAHLWE